MENRTLHAAMLAGLALGACSAALAAPGVPDGMTITPVDGKFWEWLW